MNSVAAWRGWIPIRMYGTPTGPWLDWCFVGEDRFTEPFFDHSIDKFLSDPFRLLFRRQTPLETCLELCDEAPGLEPSGFVFHMSRCGSTVVSQLLATSPAHIVVSEASIFEAVLRTGPASNAQDHRVGWLRAIVGAMSRRRDDAHAHFFVKFDAWHTVYLPLIQTAFPTVPWIFLYRDPVEVLVSLSRLGGGRLVPGHVDPCELGFDSMAADSSVDGDQWHARILARICQAAIAANSDGRSDAKGLSLFLNYADLPEAVIDLLPSCFGFSCPPALQVQMRARARYRGKAAGHSFFDDRQDKQRAATDSIREAAGLLRETYAAMEAIRRQGV